MGVALLLKHQLLRVFLAFLWWCYLSIMEKVLILVACCQGSTIVLAKTEVKNVLEEPVGDRKWGCYVKLSITPYQGTIYDPGIQIDIHVPPLQQKTCLPSWLHFPLKKHCTCGVDMALQLSNYNFSFAKSVTNGKRTWCFQHSYVQVRTHSFSVVITNIRKIKELMLLFTNHTFPESKGSDLSDKPSFKERELTLSWCWNRKGPRTEAWCHIGIHFSSWCSAHDK